MLGYLRDMGVSVLSSDEIVAQLYEDASVQAELSSQLPLESAPTRESVRELLQRQPQFFLTLNRIFHRRVLDRILAAQAQAVEVPLLIEACLQVHFQKIWVVTCGAEEQKRRLLQRYGDASRAERMLSSQLPTRAKCAFADLIVRTNRPEPDVHAFTAECVKEEFF